MCKCCIFISKKIENIKRKNRIFSIFSKISQYLLTLIANGVKEVIEERRYI